MEHQTTTGYEKRDVNIVKIIIPLVASVIFIVVFMVILDQFFRSSNESIYYKQVLLPESEALKELQQKEMNILSNYQVIDPKLGIYQIPIERAMELEVLEHSK